MHSYLSSQEMYVSFTNKRGKPPKYEELDFTGEEIQWQNSKFAFEYRKYIIVFKTTLPYQFHLQNSILT